MAKNFIVRLRTGGYSGNIVANSQVITYTQGTGSILSTDFNPVVPNLRGNVTTGSDRLATFTLTMAGTITSTTTTTTTAAPPTSSTTTTTTAAPPTSSTTTTTTAAPPTSSTTTTTTAAPPTSSTTTTTTAAPNAPSYRFTAPATTSVNEGSSINFTFESNNVAAGTVYSYRLFSTSTPAADNNDIINALIGNITSIATTASFAANTFSITANADSQTEGVETFFIKAYNSYANALAGSATVSTTGYLAQSNVVTINDTSIGTTTSTTTSTTTTTTTSTTTSTTTTTTLAPLALTSISASPTSLTFGTSYSVTVGLNRPLTTAEALSGIPINLYVDGVSAGAPVTQTMQNQTYGSLVAGDAGSSPKTIVGSANSSVASGTVSTNITYLGYANLSAGSFSIVPSTFAAGVPIVANIVAGTTNSNQIRSFDLTANVDYFDPAKNDETVNLGTLTLSAGNTFVRIDKAFSHYWSLDANVTFTAQANTSSNNFYMRGNISRTVRLVKSPISVLTLQPNVSNLISSVATPWQVEARLNRPNNSGNAIGFNVAFLSNSSYVQGSTWQPARELALYHEYTQLGQFWPSFANGSNIAVFTQVYGPAAVPSNNFYFSGTATNYMTISSGKWRTPDLAVDNPDIYLRRGATYVFDVSNTGGLSFWINTSPTGTAYANVSRLGNVDAAGINGITTGNVVFTVPFDAPDTLVYTAAGGTPYGNLIIGDLGSLRFGGMNPFGNVSVDGSTGGGGDGPFGDNSGQVPGDNREIP